jgi:hypothetical protein
VQTVRWRTARDEFGVRWSMRDLPVSPQRNYREGRRLGDISQAPSVAVSKTAAFESSSNASKLGALLSFVSVLNCRAVLSAWSRAAARDSPCGGGGRGTRTPKGVKPGGFQDRCLTS